MTDADALQQVTELLESPPAEITDAVPALARVRTLAVASVANALHLAEARAQLAVLQAKLLTWENGDAS